MNDDCDGLTVSVCGLFSEGEGFFFNFPAADILHRRKAGRWYKRRFTELPIHF